MIPPVQVLEEARPLRTRPQKHQQLEAGPSDVHSRRVGGSRRAVPNVEEGRLNAIRSEFGGYVTVQWYRVIHALGIAQLHVS
jgi:hypothetical protein